MISEEPMKLSVREFIDSLDSPRKELTVAMFAKAYQVIPHIQAAEPTEVQLRIVDADIMGAEGSVYAIYLDRGLVNWCFDVEVVPLGDIFPELSNFEFDYSLVPAMTMGWIIGHEWTHIIRKHSESAKLARLRGGEPYPGAIENAIEHDADLFSIAAVYRVLQGIYRAVLEDVGIRKLTIYSVFWALRGLPQKSHDGVHSDWQERLYHICFKLSMMGVDPFEHHDPNDVTPEMCERFKTLFEAFCACELAYDSCIDMNNSEGLIPSFLNFLHGPTPPIVMAWEWMSSIVTEVSQTPADNSKRFFDQGRIIPPPVTVDGE